MKLPDGQVHLWMFDVGQGDALLLQSPSGGQVMIDAGPDLTALVRLGEVLPRGDTSIDLLVLTHPHLDHLAAFPEILRRYKIGGVMLAGVKYPGERYEEMLQEITKHRVSVILPDPAKDVDFGDGLVLDVISPNLGLFGRAITLDEANNTSTVIRALFNDQSILLTGDMEEPQETEVLRSGADVTSTILKVAHHGSSTSTSTGFLIEVDPHVALISVGKDNKFHHPNASTLDRLTHFGIPSRTTKDEGTIHLVW
jgi:competence protein ComEC